MDLKILVMAVLVAVALVVLAYTVSFQARRRWHLRRFASQIGAEFAVDVHLEVRNKLQPFDLPDSALAGAGMARRSPALNIYLFDVHFEPSAPPRKTCCLFEWPETPRGDTLIIQSRFPSSGAVDRSPKSAFNSRFRMGESSTIIPPAPLQDALVEHAEAHRWLVELRWDGRHLLLCSHGRALHTEEEWDALLKTADACADALQNRRSPKKNSDDLTRSR